MLCRVKRLIPLYIGPLRSSLKTELMLSLLGHSKRLIELSQKIGSRESTILHALSDLMELKLVEGINGSYKLTPLGIIEANIIIEVYSGTEVVEKFRDFWLTHELAKAIPQFLLRKIGDLNDSILIGEDDLELGKVHETFIEILTSSNDIKGVSPIFHPDFIGTFNLILSRGSTAELILTSDVLKKTVKLLDVSLMAKHLNKGLKVYLRDDLHIALTVSEKIFSFGLFKLNGKYDYSVDLISYNPKAIAWGTELFEYYLLGAKSIDSKDLLALGRYS
jgi:predicted transcriptional regulator